MGLRSAFLENAAKRQTARAMNAIEEGSTMSSLQVEADREERTLDSLAGIPGTSRVSLAIRGVVEVETAARVPLGPLVAVRGNAARLLQHAR